MHTKQNILPTTAAVDAEQVRSKQCARHQHIQRRMEYAAKTTAAYAIHMCPKGGSVRLYTANFPYKVELPQ